MYKKLAPKFLIRLDDYLVVNFPTIWISKIHYVLWWGLFLHGFSALLGFLMPINLSRSGDDGLWFALISIVSFILSWFWGYRYIVFNTHKNFGVNKIRDAYINFILCFCCIAVFSTAGYLYVIVKQKRTANMVSTNVLLQDIYKLNVLEPYVPTNYYDYQNQYDTLSKETIFNLLLSTQDEVYSPYYLTNYYKNYQYSEDASRLGYKSKKINPCKTLEEVKNKISEHIQICEKYNITTYWLDVNATANFFYKYQTQGWISTSSENNFIANGRGYYKEDIKTAFRIIYEAKHNLAFVFDKDFLWAVFYVVFSLTLLITLFKLTNWQQYLITGIGMALYPLIAFIISQIFFRYNSDDCFTWLIFLLFGASTLSLFISARQNKLFKPIPNIFNAVFYLLLAFVPMLILTYLRSETNLFHYNDSGYFNTNFTVSEIVANNIKHQVYDWKYYYSEGLRNYWDKEFGRWFNFVKYFSIILVFLLQPFFTTLFAKQLALPRST